MRKDVTIKLTKGQGRVFSSQTHETIVIAGVGFGKTFCIGALLYDALKEPKSVHGLFAPSMPILKRSTLRQVQKTWLMLGFYEGEHYVINIAPPKSWGIPRLSPLGSESIITTKHGSYCILAGLDNPNSVRGTELDEIFVDEYRDVKQNESTDTRAILQGRNRGERYKVLNKQHRIWYFTTPPDNPTELKRVLSLNNPNVSFVFGTSYENQKNLPENYIETLKASYDEVGFKREVLGELVSYDTNKFIVHFDRAKHVINDSPIRFDLPVYVSFDFNVSPMTAVLAQHYGGCIRIIKEYHQKDSDIYKLCKLVRVDIDKFAKCVVTGDASGNNRSALSRNNHTFYDVISAELDIPLNSFRVPKANPAHDQSRIFCNAIFYNYPNFTIDSRCVKLINDVENVTVNEDGSINKKVAELTHLLDCMRYYLHSFHGDFTLRAAKLRGG